MTAALAQGGELPALLEGMKAREERKRVLQGELAGLEGFRQVTYQNLQRIERELPARLADFQGLLGRHPRSGEADHQEAAGWANHVPSARGREPRVLRRGNGRPNPERARVYKGGGGSNGV